MSSRRVRSMIALPMVCAAAVLLGPPSAALAADVAADAPPPPPQGQLVVSPSVQRDLPPDNIVLFNGSKNWGISYLAGKDKLADITVDGRTGKVIEAWQGVQAAWV